MFDQIRVVTSRHSSFFVTEMLDGVTRQSIQQSSQNVLGLPAAHGVVQTVDQANQLLMLPINIQVIHAERISPDNQRSFAIVVLGGLANRWSRQPEVFLRMQRREAFLEQGLPAHTPIHTGDPSVLIPSERMADTVMAQWERTVPGIRQP